MKQTLDGFPRGGERTAAEALVRIWSDTARVWAAPATPETATAAAPAETATTAPIPEQRAKGTSYILPGMLIPVGLGVLVLLFKTSS